MDYHKRRQEIITRHTILQKTRGSGWHPADYGALERETKGELELGDRPVAIRHDDNIVFCGECANRIRVAIKFLLAATEDLTGNGLPYQQRVCKVLSKLLTQTETITLPDREWNNIAVALEVSKVQCVMTGITD